FGLVYTVMLSCFFFFFFFFQAEDGIRDKLVTGVQTCALPISSRQAAWRLLAAIGRLDWNAARDAVAGVADHRISRPVSPPSSACDDRPSHPRQWEWYRSVIQSMLLRRVGAGEARGLLLAAPWV